jgi:hypothetical protein
MAPRHAAKTARSVPNREVTVRRAEARQLLLPLSGGLKPAGYCSPLSGGRKPAGYCSPLSGGRKPAGYCSPLSGGLKPAGYCSPPYVAGGLQPAGQTHNGSVYAVFITL